MPTYNYKCQACEYEFEKFMRMSEMELPTKENCPSCDAKDQVKKIIASTVGFVRPNDMKSLDGDFKYAMKQMKKRHRRSNIPDY